MIGSPMKSRSLDGFQSQNRNALTEVSVPGPSVIYVITRGFSSGRAVGLLAR